VFNPISSSDRKFSPFFKTPAKNMKDPQKNRLRVPFRHTQEIVTLVLNNHDFTKKKCVLK